MPPSQQVARVVIRSLSGLFSVRGGEGGVMRSDGGRGALRTARARDRVPSSVLAAVLGACGGGGSSDDPSVLSAGQLDIKLPDGFKVVDGKVQRPAQAASAGRDRRRDRRRREDDRDHDRRHQAGPDDRPVHRARQVPRVPRQARRQVHRRARCVEPQLAHQRPDLHQGPDDVRRPIQHPTGAGGLAGRQRQPHARRRSSCATRATSCGAPA